MIRIVLFAYRRLLEEYQEERNANLFEKVYDSLVKEFGKKKIRANQENSNVLVLDLDADVDFSDLKDFIYTSSELNDEQLKEINISLFYVSANSKRTSLQDKKRKGNGNAFIDLVNNLSELKKELEEEVFGQSHAINELVSGLLTAYLKDSTSNSPLATFTLMGPEGCGKSFLAEKTAKALYVLNGTKYKILNATDYEKSSTTDEIVKFVYSNPDCTLVFNDLLKTVGIGDLIISAISLGEYDNVSFRKVTMIFTTKMGESIYNSSFTGNLSNVPKETLFNAINHHLSNDFTKNLANGKLIMLNFAPQEMLRSVASNEICNVFKDFSEKTNVEIDCDLTHLPSAILYMNKGNYNIPIIKKNVNDFFNKELSDLFTQVDNNTGRPLLSSTKLIDFELCLDDADASVKNLFAERTLNALVVCKKDDSAFFKSLKVKNVNFITVSTAIDAIDALNKGVDFVLLDVLTGIGEMESIPTNLEDYASQGVDVFNYIETYFREIPLYLMSNENYELLPTNYASFLNTIARDIFYFNKEDDEDVKETISIIQEEIEIARDLATLIGEGKCLSYSTKQIFNDETSVLTVKIGKLALENVERKLESRYLTSYLSNLKFNDIIGHESAKKVLKRYAAFLTRNGTYLGPTSPKGFLIYGRSGLGKGLLAKALAGETNSAFVSYDANDIIYDAIYADCSPTAKIKEIFSNVKQCSPAVLHIENIESLLLNRNEEIQRTILSEIQSLNKDKKQHVLLVGTTVEYKDEFPDNVIDCFDRIIGVFSPTKDERREFIKKYLTEKKITSLSNEAIETIVIQTQYYTYKFIKTLIDFAVTNAKGQELTDLMFIDSFDLYTIGEETNTLSDENCATTAYHEIGHFLVDYLLGNHPSFVTIVSRGSFFGYTSIDQQEGKVDNTKRDFLNRICMSLAGRAAEVIVFGEQGINTGIGGDIKQATYEAKALVCYYGMDKYLYTTRAIENEESIPPAMLERIDAILHEQYERALKLLSDNRDKLEALSQALIKKKSLTADECEKIIANLK